LPVHFRLRMEKAARSRPISRDVKRQCHRQEDSRRFTSSCGAARSRQPQHYLQALSRLLI
jgi:hypothetical protein